MAHTCAIGIYQTWLDGWRMIPVALRGVNRQTAQIFQLSKGREAD